jgi:hypothetical protein
MTDGRSGRLLTASLHEAIAERLPQRLEFYEHWLSSEGLREGRVGLAPVAAVLGFLRTEGDGYDAVMTRAGELAAKWSILNLSPSRRRMVGSLPRFLRTRSAMRIAAAVVRDVEGARRTTTRVRWRTARLELTDSLFCNVRTKSPIPLCGYYLAVAVETLRHFGIDGVGRSDRCRAVEGAACRLVIDLGGRAAPGEAKAA